MKERIKHLQNESAAIAKKLLQKENFFPFGDVRQLTDGWVSINKKTICL
jgi:hypothetical protein